MIHAQTMHHRGIHIMHMDWVFRDVIAVIIGLAVQHTALDTTTSHPNGKAPGMVIPAIILRRQIPLAIHRPAEFPAPNDERFIQHPALLQIRDQRRRRLVRIHALPR